MSCLDHCCSPQSIPTASPFQKVFLRSPICHSCIKCASSLFGSMLFRVYRLFLYHCTNYSCSCTMDSHRNFPQIRCMFWYISLGCTILPNLVGFKKTSYAARTLPSACVKVFHQLCISFISNGTVHISLNDISVKHVKQILTFMYRNTCFIKHIVTV